VYFAQISCPCFAIWGCVHLPFPKRDHFSFGTSFFAPTLDGHQKIPLVGSPDTPFRPWHINTVLAVWPVPNSIFCTRYRLKQRDCFMHLLVACGSAETPTLERPPPEPEHTVNISQLLGDQITLFRGFSSNRVNAQKASGPRRCYFAVGVLTRNHESELTE
jgi:hypothetical protein